MHIIILHALAILILLFEHNKIRISVDMYDAYPMGYTHIKYATQNMRSSAVTTVT